jgi:hypothetical protein
MVKQRFWNNFRHDGDAVFVVLLIYPETKGVTLEDMEKKLATS